MYRCLFCIYLFIYFNRTVARHSLEMSWVVHLRLRGLPETLIDDS